MSKEHDLSNAIDAYLNKAKPKVLKPGSPEHTKAMAEMEAVKAAKPKSRNPAGEEHPSAAGSRDKLGERPLVEGIDKQALQTAAERAGAGLRGGQSAPAPSTTTPAPATPAPTTPAPKPAAPAPATPTTEASDGMTVAQRNRGVYGRQQDAAYAAQPKSEFKPDARLRNKPPGGYGNAPVKPKASFSAPQHGPGSEPRGIGTRIRDVAQNAMYATGIKNPAKQPVEERARVGGKEHVVVGKREGGAKNRALKNVRQAGQVSPAGVIHYPRDTGQYLKSLDESLEKSIDILKIWGSVDRVIPKTELDIDLLDDISILKSFELEETTNIEDLVEGTLVHKMLVDRANRPTSDWWESSMSIAKSINNIDEPAFLSAYLYYDPDTFVLEDFIDVEKAEVTRGKPQDLEMMPNTSGGSAIDGLGMSADDIELYGPKDEDCDK